MKVPNWFLLPVVAAFIVACGDGGNEPGPPPGEQARLEEGLESLRQAGEEAMRKATAAGEDVMRQAHEASAEMLASAEQAGVAASDAMVAKARELIDEAKSLLAENDLDTASGIMDKLSKFKDSLPASIAAEVDKLAAMIDSARQSGNETEAQSQSH